MSTSGPVSNGPDEQESLEELFGTVFDLANMIATRISPDNIEMRLRRTLREAHEISVIALVERAVNNDRDAWNDIVERYAPLIWSVCTRYRLNDPDIEDVGQTVWLLLVEHLGKLREPAALPGWLVTTTHRECQRALTAARKTESGGERLDETLLVVDAAVIEQEILAAERDEALRLALRELPSRCQQLLAMLMSGPPRSYAEISAALQIPIGSIGPQRARCLERLRRSIALVDISAGEMRVSSAGDE